MSGAAPSSNFSILKVRDGRGQCSQDHVAVEEPLEIRLAGYSVAVTMRTPGDDFALAAGFLFSEGIIGGSKDIATIAHCEADDLASQGNIVNVNPSSSTIVDPSRWQRNFFVTSSCGVCGKSSIRDVRQQAQPLDTSLRVAASFLQQPARQAGHGTSNLPPDRRTSRGRIVRNRRTICSSCGKMWDVTTRWTKSSGRCYSPAGSHCPNAFSS